MTTCPAQKSAGAKRAPASPNHNTPVKMWNGSRRVPYRSVPRVYSHAGRMSSWYGPRVRLSQGPARSWEVGTLLRGSSPSGQTRPGSRRVSASRYSLRIFSGAESAESLLAGSTPGCRSQAFCAMMCWAIIPAREELSTPTGSHRSYSDHPRASATVEEREP